MKMFKCIQESDYADYWAFFYQTWRLLALSQDVKINTMNLFLNKYAPYAGSAAEAKNGGPPAGDIRYTPVLTKQSALFNAWKLLCEISESRGVPVRLAPMYAFAEIQDGSLRPDKVRRYEAISLEQLNKGVQG